MNFKNRSSIVEGSQNNILFYFAKVNNGLRQTSVEKKHSENKGDNVRSMFFSLQLCNKSDCHTSLIDLLKEK